MSQKLDNLRSLVKEAFKEADTQEEVKKQALIENAINEVEKEENEFLEKHKTLVNDYKDLLMAQGSKEKPKDDIPSGSVINFDDALNQFLQNQK